MPTTLHLGVLDQPYAQPVTTKTGRVKTGQGGTATTGDVAEWLEAKYHVMELFFVENEAEIVRALEDSVEGALQSILMGAPPILDPYGTATARIETLFRKFIDEKKLDGVVPGVPTMASIIGIRRRFKSRRDPGRPSFQDTGLYEASFKSWVD